MPYTVGVFSLYLLFGIAAELMQETNDCPWIAWRYRSASKHGHRREFVTRKEWSWFDGSGVLPGAYCGANPDPPVVKSTCGDGSPNPPGCRWTFDDLVSVSEGSLSTAATNYIPDMAHCTGEAVPPHRTLGDIYPRH
jgi:hypothetical protein